MDILHEEGWGINNIDLTIILERPKLANYKPLIKNKLAEILRISPAAISVKAKTNEKMGFLGRGEGVAALAAVTLIRNH